MSNIKYYIKHAPVYGAAAILVAASTVMNARFGYSMGENEIDRMVWTGASIGSDIMKAASPVVLVWSWRNRSVLTGFAAILLMAITVTYSALAAIGFTATARDAMSSDRAEQFETRKRAKATYEGAVEELSALGLPRPATALEARISAILANPLADTPQGKCGMLDGDYTRKYCPVVARLKAELAKARRKEKLEQDRDATKAVLDHTPIVKNADPQAATVAVFIEKATGLQVSAQNIQPWISGIAALLVELGSTLGFLVAGAASPTNRHERHGNSEFAHGPHGGPVIEHQPAKTLPEAHGNEERGGSLESVLKIAHDTGKPPFAGIERRSCGTLRVSQRRLASAMGKGRRAITQNLQELANKGKITLRATKAGTIVTMVG